MSRTDDVLKTARKLVDYRMIWRWHFYAGLICIPFVIILSITGPIYLFKPEIEAAIDRRYDNLPFESNPEPLKALVEAALASVPGSQFHAVEVRPNVRDAARVILNRNGEKIRVYVHPQTLVVLKTVPDEARFMAVVKTIHGELVMGKVGGYLVELAASWAIVMVITGLYLWWPREAKGVAGVLWPRLGMGRKIFWRDLHGVTGIYVSGFALFLLLTGLPWTSVWGDGFKTVRKAFEPQAAQTDWRTGRISELEHHSHGADSSTSNLSGLEFMTGTMRRLDLPPPVMVVAPSIKKPVWQGLSDTPNRPQRVTMTLDPVTGDILTRSGFTDKSAIDQAVGIGIAAHEGQLFGLFNQILGVLTALGLITLCVSAVVMWWHRRPDKQTLGAPKILPDERLGAGLVALIIALGVFLPMMGLALIVVGVIEFAVLRRIVPVRDWLGLKV